MRCGAKFGCVARAAAKTRGGGRRPRASRLRAICNPGATWPAFSGRERAASATTQRHSTWLRHASAASKRSADYAKIVVAKSAPLVGRYGLFKRKARPRGIEGRARAWARFTSTGDAVVETLGLPTATRTRPSSLIGGPRAFSIKQPHHREPKARGASGNFHRFRCETMPAGLLAVGAFHLNSRLLAFANGVGLRRIIDIGVGALHHLCSTIRTAAWPASNARTVNADHEKSYRPKARQKAASNWALERHVK